MNKHAAALVPADALPLDDATMPTSTTFERLLKDPDVSADKLERFLAMRDRMSAKEAEQRFNVAMSQAQAKIRHVAADSDNPQTRSRYASYAALDKALRPIYAEFGFALSFDTGDAPQPEFVRVLCYVSHQDGHARTYRVDMPADGKGAKGGDVMTKTHATGSAVSYGMRYLLKMIFNVAVGDDDDDGNKAGVQTLPDKPKGYEAWVIGLEQAAPKGTPALQAVWKQGTKELRAYHVAVDHDGWEALKREAGSVK
jgi:hypothetical protein